MGENRNNLRVTYKIKRKRIRFRYLLVRHRFKRNLRIKRIGKILIRLDLIEVIPSHDNFKRELNHQIITILQLEY